MTLVSGIKLPNGTCNEVEVSESSAETVLEKTKQTVVVKIGTSTLMREASADDSDTVSGAAGRFLDQGEGELAVSTLALLVDTLLALRREGHDVVLVTSGAVGVGCREMGVKERPRPTPGCGIEKHKEIMAQIQAYAAIGQNVLMNTYDRFMRMANQPVAQVLLTSSDLSCVYQYQNAKNTIGALLKMGVIPIVNENDTVATEEIKYGDNDWLSALVSTAIEADWLFLLTDVEQLYTANPRTNPDARPIPVVEDIQNLNINISSKATGTQWGTGGINTKITAARLATAAGVRVCLIHGRHPTRVLDYVQGNQEKVGTLFEPHRDPISAEKKRWLSNCLHPKGDVFVTPIAADAIQRGSKLLTSGVTDVSSDFEPNSAVRICKQTGEEIARGICNFASATLKEVRGKHGDAVSDYIGTATRDVVVDEDNLAILTQNNGD